MNKPLATTMSAAPQVFVHTKDLNVPTAALDGHGVPMSALRWK